MRAPVNEALLIGGEISNVKFSPQKDRAFVEFKDEEGFVFEFNNNKKPRADHVKKLRIKKGDSVIAIGAISGGSKVYGYGYDIMREGRISEGPYSMIRGKVQKVVRTSKTTILYLSDNGQQDVIVCKNGLVKEVEPDDFVTCLCLTKQEMLCQATCKKLSVRSCALCTSKSKQRRYVAFRVEQNKEENNNENRGKTDEGSDKYGSA